MIIVDTDSKRTLLRTVFCFVLVLVDSLALNVLV